MTKTRRAVSRVLMVGCLATGWLAATPGPVQAADAYVMSFALLGGIGGVLDAGDPDPGIDQPSFELQANLVTEPRTLVGLRLGRMDFGKDDRIGDFGAPQLDYATVSGEYRFYDNWYDSGIFFGLGGYRLRGDSVDEPGRDREKTVVGVTAGVTGEFEIAKHFALTGELSAHYLNLDEAQIFANALAGFVVRY